MKPAPLSVVVALVTATMVFGAVPVGAEPGDADATFGTCGLRLWSPPDAPSGSLHSTVAQPDGKILQVGQDDDRSISVTRLVASGAGIDRTYGTQGTARVAIPRLMRITGAAVGPDGKLVVAGVRNSTDARGAMDLVRLTASGVLDASFGLAGAVRSNRLPAEGILVQDDNRVVVWGGPPWSLQRYNVNGTRDTSWAPVLPDDGRVAAATVATNGDLLVAWTILDTEVFRFTPTGEIDGSFAASFAFPGGGLYEPTQVVEQTDGKVVVVGVLRVSAGLVPDTFVGAARLTTSGAVDTTYGNAGFATIAVPWSPFPPVARIDAQGRLIVAGTFGSDPAFSSVVLTRFTASGAPDASFGNAGVSSLDIGDWARVSGLVLRGKWIIVGNGFSNRAETAALVRFRTDSTTLGAGYTLDHDGGLHPFRFGLDPPPPCVTDGPRLPGLARGVTTVTNRGGLVIDGFGGLHRFSAGARRVPAPPKGAPYWPGWDIARGVAALSNGKGGYVLDGFGGIHRYRTGSNLLPPPIVNGPYWPGWDIARGIALMPDGKSGYVVDGFGGIHPFAVAGTPLPPPVTTGPPRTPDFARGIAILADGSGGYITNTEGSIWSFGIGSHAPPPLPSLNPPLLGSFRGSGVTFVAPRVGAG